MNSLGESLSAPLSSTAGPASPSTAPPESGFRNAPPCSVYYGQKIDTTDPAYNGQHLPYVPCGYTPGQLRSAYGIASAVNKGVDGRGQTVAVIRLVRVPDDLLRRGRVRDPERPGTPSSGPRSSPSTCSRRTQPSRGRMTATPPTRTARRRSTSKRCTRWPPARTSCTSALRTAGLLTRAGAELRDRQGLADVVSNSYGGPGRGKRHPAPDEIQTYNQIAIEAALEGISLNLASGDDGDEASPPSGQPEADFQASDPWVTAVGGTSLGVGANGQRVFETGWETAESAR